MQEASATSRGLDLGELYERHAGEAIVLAYLLTGDKDEAEDIVQDAFVRLVGRFTHRRKPEAFGAYLKRTVVNLCHSHFRKQKVRRAHLERAKARLSEVAVAPELPADDNLRGALLALPMRQRAALALRFFEDLSERQTAELLGCSVTAVRSSVYRGMESLREGLRGER